MIEQHKHNDYCDYVINYLSMASTGALLFTGEWGSGKTYYVKNILFDRVESETNFTPLLVSLYGEKSKSDIAKKLIFAYLDKKGESAKLSTSTIVKNLKALSRTVPIINKYFSVENLLIGAEENIINFLPGEKLLICFDDLERMSQEIDPNDFLGLVNELVENRGAKVLLIANEEEIKHQIIYKEKTIEKTVHYIPEFFRIVEKLIESSSYQSFADFCLKNKDFIFKSISPGLEYQILNSDLKKSLSNIRTLKFAIEHFRSAFTIVSQKLDISDDAVQKKLRNIWLFVLAISAEYRKPNNISFKDRKGMDQQIPPVIGNFQLKAKIEADQIEEINKWSYPKKIQEMYFTRLSEPFIFYDDVYDLITSGKTIDVLNFITKLNEQIENEKARISPAHTLLDSFMFSGWLNFSNTEFSQNLSQLLCYVENSSFRSLSSYFNAGICLLRFSTLIEISSEQIIEFLKKGIGGYLIKSNNTPNVEFQLLANEFNRYGLEQVVSYTHESIKRIEEEKIKKSAEEFGEMLETNIEHFLIAVANNFSATRNPDKPILHLIPKYRIKSAIRAWSPKEISDINTFIASRYLNASFIINELASELKFLEHMRDCLADVNLEKPLLSNYLIENYLIPTINNCIDALSSSDKL